MLSAISTWVESTALSVLVQDVLWMIPTLQIIHIIAISVVVSSVVMVSLRVLGLAGGMLTISDTSRRFLPWIWAGLVVLALTGLILIIGEPKRSLSSPVFQAKMAMLVVAVGIAAYFAHTLRRNVAFWETSSSSRRVTRIVAVATVLLWCAIVTAGRWVAYA